MTVLCHLDPPEGAGTREVLGRVEGGGLGGEEGVLGCEEGVLEGRVLEAGGQEGGLVWDQVRAHTNTLGESCCRSVYLFVCLPKHQAKRKGSL